jgi:hypothetical protein
MTGATRFARVLGTDPASATRSFQGRPDQTVPGFRVVDAEPGHRLTLQGRRRFSRYRLTFLLDDDGLRAQTHGKFYRAAVIASGGRIITRRLLRRIEELALGRLVAIPEPKDQRSIGKPRGADGGPRPPMMFVVCLTDVDKLSNFRID